MNILARSDIRIISFTVPVHLHLVSLSLPKLSLPQFALPSLAVTPQLHLAALHPTSSSLSVVTETRY